MVIVAVGVAIAVPRIQKLDRGNNATFLFGQNTTLLISRYTKTSYNKDYVNSSDSKLDAICEIYFDRFSLCFPASLGGSIGANIV